MILDLADNERAAYQTLMHALANGAYQPPAITDQIVAAIRTLARDDATLAPVGQRLIQLLHDDTSITRLIAALSDRDLSYPAALILGWCGDRALPAVSALVDAIGWGPSLGVGAARTAVAQIGGDPEPLLTGLQRAVHASNDDAFVQLMGAVAQCDLVADERMRPILITAATNANAAIRECTADAIGTLSTVQRLPFAATITRLLTDESPHVRESMQQSVLPA